MSEDEQYKYTMQPKPKLEPVPEPVPEPEPVPTLLARVEPEFYITIIHNEKAQQSVPQDFPEQPGQIFKDKFPQVKFTLKKDFYDKHLPLPQPKNITIIAQVSSMDFNYKGPQGMGMTPIIADTTQKLTQLSVRAVSDTFECLYEFPPVAQWIEKFAMWNVISIYVQETGSQSIPSWAIRVVDPDQEQKENAAENALINACINVKFRYGWSDYRITAAAKQDGQRMIPLTFEVYDVDDVLRKTTFKAKKLMEPDVQWEHSCDREVKNCWIKYIKTLPPEIQTEYYNQWLPE